MIQTKTGFNITKAIEINILSREQDEGEQDVKTRKSAPIEIAEKHATPGRKAAAPKYEVVSLSE